MLPSAASGVSCKTQSQLTTAERNVLSTAARQIASRVQAGDAQSLRANTIPAVAADFGGIASTVEGLAPLVQRATITIDSLYSLDASAQPGAPTQPAGARTDFFCGQPVVALNFIDLPPGTYALAILHATGVPKPQQISLVLSATPDHRWMLAGFFNKPMIVAGHDGLWYWQSARSYAQKNMKWNAWFYYRTAGSFLNPVDFLSSPNLEKLRHEEEGAHPDNLPGAKPLMITALGSQFQITAVDTTSVFGDLDLDVHYAPNPTQIAQLRDPPSARKQVTDAMTALLALHPELLEAFHGIWIHADNGAASVFSLELPMGQIVTDKLPPASGSMSVPHS